MMMSRRDETGSRTRSRVRGLRSAVNGSRAAMVTMVLAILAPAPAAAESSAPGTAAISSPSAGPSGGEFVIRDVRIFDGEKVIPKGQVWVKDGRIEAVGETVHAPVGVAVVGGEGETLLPGLIDGHVHVYGSALKDALVFGVTTALDMFTDPHLAATMRKEQAEGKALDRADLLSAGTLVTAPHGHGTEYGIDIPTINGPEEAQPFVDARIAEGSDYIKIIYDDGRAYGHPFPTISKETMAAVVAAAHRRHKLAVAHIGSLSGARDALESGVDGLEHLFVDAPADPDFAALARSRHAFVVPTLSVLATMCGTGWGDSLGADERIHSYLSAMSLSGLHASFGHAIGKFSYAAETVKQLHDLRVPILAGTDAPNPGTTQGASLHGELQLLARCGLTPVEALRAATSVPARLFHLDDRGRIRKGKRADLLLVRGDPTTDITATRDIVSVWKQGVPADRDAVLAAREQERKAAEDQRHAPSPAGSESGLISDFEGGSADSRFGLGWNPSTDNIMGGKSTVALKVVDGGADGSAKALQVDGEVASGSITWAGAIFFPGAEPMSPVNLSGRRAISFWAKGDSGTCQLMVYSQSAGYIPRMKPFALGAEWRKVSMPLADFGTDGHDLTGIQIGMSGTPGRFHFLVDSVRME